MGFDNKYPYTDFHEINLDWLLEKVKGIDDRFVAIEEKVAELSEDLDIQTGRIDAALDAITFIQNHYPAMIASQYDESRQYDPGEIAIYDNELYIALPGETPGPWNGNYWNKTSLGDELGTIIIKVNDIILPDLSNINNVLAEYGTLFDDIVETYVPGSTYTKNQMVKYEDHIYRVMVASTNNPPTDTADWDPETLANIVTDLLNFWNKIIPEYDETSTYNVPDYVIYQGNIYTCNAANVTGAWDGSKWNAVILTDDIASRLAFMYGMFGALYGWYKSFYDVDTYHKGDVVNYNGTLYECIADNVTGEWDASKWQTQKVTDAMTDVNTYYKNFPVNTLNGNPVEIADAVKAPVESAIVSFNPVQSGSGTPSPGNVRPFVLWDNLNLNKCNEEYAQLWTIDTNFDGNVNFNQLVQNGNFASTTGWSANNGISISAANNELTVSIDSDPSDLVRVQGSITPATIIDHIYLQKVDAKSSQTNIMRMYCPTDNSTPLFNLTTTYSSCYTIIKATRSAAVVQPFRLNTSDTKPIGNTYTVKNFNFIDLTQMFGSTIADYIYSLEQATAGSGVAFFRSMYPNDYYPYNTGTSEIVGTNIATATFDSTVYGGSYDFVSGKGKSEWGYIASYNGETITEPWLSSIDEYIPNTSPSTGAEVVYKLSTPVPFTLPGNNIMTLSGNNTIWTDGDDVEISYHYSEQSVDYTPDDRVVVIGTYSGKRVMQRNTFLQNIALDATQHTYNDVFPAGKLVTNAWMVIKGNDDSSSGINLPGVLNDDGSAEFALYAWGNNTAADVWLYVQYVE